MQNSQSNEKQCAFLKIQNHDFSIPVTSGQECSEGFRKSGPGPISLKNFCAKSGY